MMEIIKKEFLTYLEATGPFSHGLGLWRVVDQGRTA